MRHTNEDLCWEEINKSVICIMPYDISGVRFRWKSLVTLQIDWRRRIRIGLRFCFGMRLAITIQLVFLAVEIRVPITHLLE